MVRYIKNRRDRDIGRERERAREMDSKRQERKVLGGRGRVADTDGAVMRERRKKERERKKWAIEIIQEIKQR